jgi:tetratricopeptide (TPR) repeat protein
MATRKRVRGVIASRNKLEVAMLNAGIRSQSELAKLIAEKENINSPPRDLVNRTFRQTRVSHQTITRIATVLDVPPHSLFLTQDELESEEELNPVTVTEEAIHNDKSEPLSKDLEDDLDTSEENVHENLIPPSPPPTSPTTAVKTPRNAGTLRHTYIVAFFIISAALISLTSLWNPSENTVDSVTTPLAKVQSLMIIKGTSELEKELARNLTKRLKKDFTISSVSISDIAANDSPYSLAENYNVDLVISLELVEKGIFKALLGFAYTTANKTLLASLIDSETIVTEKTIDKSSAKLESALKQYLSTSEYTYKGLDETNAKNYVSSQALLHKGLNEGNVNAALEKTHLILASAPTNPLVLAQLCNLYAQKMYLTADDNYLIHATDACNRASEQAKDKPEVLFSLAQKSRRENDIDSAIAYYSEVLKVSPNYSFAYVGLTESYLKKFLMTKSSEAMSLAKESIVKASRLAPNDWMIPFIEARLHYYEGNASLALKKFEESKDIEVTQNVLGNLGSIYFCEGNIESAFQNYKAMEHEFGASNISDHLLATASFYMQKYDDAIEYNLKSLEAMTDSNSNGLYPIWINLGDSYLAKGMKQEAMGAYEQAVKISQRSDQNTTVMVDQLYAYLHISRINHTFETKSVKMGIRDELSSIESQVSDPGAKFRSMVIWAYLGEKEKARSIQKVLTAQCKGLAKYPGVEKILN